MRRRQRAGFAFLFLLPATALYGIFVVWPLIGSLIFSFYSWTGVSEKRTFVGLTNFHTLIVDSVFWQALEHNLILFGGAGAVVLCVSLLLAQAMQANTRSSRLLRSVYLFPQVMSLVVVAILWMFIYNPEFGLLNGFLRVLGLGSFATGWLGDKNTALAAVAVAYIWQALGFYTMLLSAGLQTIPADVYEAARLDGSSGVTTMTKITLPMMWGVLRIAVVYIAINTLNIFALIYLMTQGGPDRHSEVLLTYMYEKGFVSFEFGLATALAALNLVLVLILSGLILLAFGRDPQEARR